MARKPNYDFERREREKAKAAKKEDRAKAKAERKRDGEPGEPDPATPAGEPAGQD